MSAGMRRSPRGSVDRNTGTVGHISNQMGRSPRGSVDRNFANAKGVTMVYRVAPRAGAWIETVKPRNQIPYFESLPARERG